MNKHNFVVSDTIMPCSQSAGLEKYCGTENKFGVPNSITAVESSIPSTSRYDLKNTSSVLKYKMF
jgi:hypothetical protein